jgi:hypothetical protein
MPLPAQFSLSLELTKLVPAGLAAAGKTFTAALSLARDLQVGYGCTIIESYPFNGISKFLFITDGFELNL